MAKVKNHYWDEIEARRAKGEMVLAPTKNGSKNCANAEAGRNGSIASGGTIKYCTCDRCF